MGLVSVSSVMTRVIIWNGASRWIGDCVSACLVVVVAVVIVVVVLHVDVVVVVVVATGNGVL